MSRLFHRDTEVTEALPEDMQFRPESLECNQFSAEIKSWLARHSWMLSSNFDGSGGRGFNEAAPSIDNGAAEITLERGARGPALCTLHATLAHFVLKYTQPATVQGNCRSLSCLQFHEQSTNLPPCQRTRASPMRSPARAPFPVRTRSQGNETRTTDKLLVSRIKKIIQLDEDIVQCSNNSTFVIAMATVSRPPPRRYLYLVYATDTFLRRCSSSTSPSKLTMW